MSSTSMLMVGKAIVPIEYGNIWERRGYLCYDFSEVYR